MNLLRKIIIKVLGIQLYLTIISKVYVFLTTKGCMKKKYPELFFLHKIIKSGDTCIDIGANLGYYSTKMSILCGTGGHVYAVEPVPMFYSIWAKNVKQSGIQNLELFPFALGCSEGVVQMGMPEKNGLAHHGMTKVTNSSNETFVKLFDVNMRIPDNLFSKLNRLDFIKCDIEGYENIAFANMTETLKRFTPIIQCELGGDENREKVISQLESFGYTTYILNVNTLVIATPEVKKESTTDFYFLQGKHSWLLK